MYRKRKGFSFIEIIVASFIFLLVFIPALNLNSKQVHLIRKIGNSDFDINFLHSLLSYLKAKNYFTFDDVSLNFQNYQELKNNSIFEDFNLNYPLNENFSLSIDFRFENVNFYSHIQACNIIDIKFKKFNKIHSYQIIKFKE